ncbi:hypothetical protein [Cytobacillus firmus]|uniref:hypothetical protein n=1 Tax=Cytobacillus firmus TaxID=1399 RepID=UPI001C94ABCE|nr:hypothetical protein [Cytobacillus firmus]MBY6053316.1 hypothetical protein [Cytobacillus firmus]
MEKIIAFVILILATISLSYTLFIWTKNTLFVWTKKSYAHFKRSISYLKKREWISNFNNSSLNLKLENVFPRVLLLKNKKEISTAIFILTVSFIVVIFETPIESKIPGFINLILLIILLIGLVKFFTYSSNDSLINFQNWLWRVLLLIIFTLNFLKVYLEDPLNYRFLIVLTIFIIIFSVILIANALKNFNNMIFQLLNFIFGFGLILCVAGISFGLFYLENNDIFNLYTLEEYNKIMFHFDSSLTTYLFIIYKGLIPFYSFPSSGITLDQPITLILLCEYIIGFVFNVIIIGFFVSYFVTKFSKRYEEQ